MNDEKKKFPQEVSLSFPPHMKIFSLLALIEQFWKYFYNLISFSRVTVTIPIYHRVKLLIISYIWRQDVLQLRCSFSKLLSFHPLFFSLSFLFLMPLSFTSMLQSFSHIIHKRRKKNSNATIVRNEFIGNVTLAIGKFTKENFSSHIFPLCECARVEINSIVC